MIIQMRVELNFKSIKNWYILSIHGIVLNSKKKMKKQNSNKKIPETYSIENLIEKRKTK